jgi:peptidylprolyl isomerase
MRRRLSVAILLVGIVLATACGSDGDDDAAPSSTTAPATSLPGTVGAGAEPAVGDRAAAKPAVSIPDPLPEGLFTEDLIVGDGAEVPAGATVTVEYVGVLTDGTEFDSSWSRPDAATFPLDGVIPGWTQGIPGMRVGGRRLLVIPADLAYGAQGQPPTIPPDATLVFVVDVVDFDVPPPTTAPVLPISPAPG